MTRSDILVSINTSWNIYHFRAPLIRALRQAGYRVSSAAPPDDYSQRLHTIVDTHIDLPMDNAGTSPLRDGLLFIRYLRLLKQLRPAILLTYTIKPNVYGTLAAALLGIPSIANVSGLGTTFIHRGLVTRLVKLLYRLAFRYTHCVFFQNPEDMALFLQERLVSPKKARLLPGSGINLTEFAPQNPPSSAPDAPAFLLIARLLWDKGIGEYVEAARIVKRQHPNVRFRLMGARDVKNQTAIPNDVLDQWIAEGIIDYLGHQDDVRPAIAAHDCIVLPSYREGLPRTLLEAAAMGKPLIATDVPGCRQLVTTGDNGLLCFPHDAADLARCMLEFIMLPSATRQQMGQRSRTIAEYSYDESLVFRAYLDAIDETVSRL
jgi:glycosyltransferase involved in cell wall biosynthesis